MHDFFAPLTPNAQKPNLNKARVASNVRMVAASVRSVFRLGLDLKGFGY